MRALPANLAQHLQGELLNLALCVRIETQGGVILGFTDHDRDLVLGGVTYEAGTSADASALRHQAGTGIDNLDVRGLVTSDRITETDLLAGRYDGAKLDMFLVNYEQIPLTEASPLLSGTLGEVTLSQGVYVVEVRSLMQRLAQQIVELTSPVCRVKALGDARCKVSLPAFQRTRSVSTVVSASVLRFGSDTEVAGFYSHGRVRFNTGANTGIEREVKQHTAVGGSVAEITLQEPFPFAVAVGNSAMLEAGCDRLPATCETRFQNRVNFRGEDFLPGSDKILRIGRK